MVITTTSASGRRGPSGSGGSAASAASRSLAATVCGASDSGTACSTRPTIAVRSYDANRRIWLRRSCQTPPAPSASTSTVSTARRGASGRARGPLARKPSRIRAASTASAMVQIESEVWNQT